eukprot:9353178-Pyramimonas_sp.AAC.2
MRHGRRPGPSDRAGRCVAARGLRRVRVLSAGASQRGLKRCCSIEPVVEQHLAWPWGSSAISPTPPPALLSEQ